MKTLTALAYEMAALTARWDREDRELADARFGSGDFDRINEAIEDKRIAEAREQEVMGLLFKHGLEY